MHTEVLFYHAINQLKLVYIQWNRFNNTYVGAKPVLHNEDLVWEEIQSQGSRSPEFTKKQNKTKNPNWWNPSRSTAEAHMCQPMGLGTFSSQALSFDFHVTQKHRSLTLSALWFRHVHTWFLGPSRCQVWVTSPWAKRVIYTRVGSRSRAWGWQEENCSGIFEAVFKPIPIHPELCHGEVGTGQQNGKLFCFLITELNNIVSEVDDI